MAQLLVARVVVNIVKNYRFACLSDSAGNSLAAFRARTQVNSSGDFPMMPERAAHFSPEKEKDANCIKMENFSQFFYDLLKYRVQLERLDLSSSGHVIKR